MEAYVCMKFSFLYIYDKLNFYWILKPANYYETKTKTMIWLGKLFFLFYLERPLSCSFCFFIFLPDFQNFILTWSHKDDNVHHRPVPRVTGILSTFIYGSVQNSHGNLKNHCLYWCYTFTISFNIFTTKVNLLLKIVLS